MIPEDHKEQIIDSGISFLRSITEAYGSDEGMKLWDVIASTLDPDVKGQIFFAMLVGDHKGEITLRGMDQNAANFNYVNIIKTIREITNWGLKEAKDCADAVRGGSRKRIPVSDAMNRSRHVSNLRSLGVEI